MIWSPAETVSRLFIFACFSLSGKTLLTNSLLNSMKRTVLLMAFYTSCLHSFGQATINVSTNIPRSGDSYVLTQMEYFAQGDEGNDVVWDFSGLKSLDTRCRREYFLSRDSVLMCVDDECASSYELKGDTLLCLGYDTRLKHMSYTNPMTMITYPFRYGYNIMTPFHGIGDYCKSLIIKSDGTIIVDADAEGSIVWSDGDTLRNVLRVHTTRLTSLSMHALSDTLFQDTSHMKQEIEDSYSWYVRGYRYPMYETSSVCFYDNMTPVSCVQKSFMYQPDEFAFNDEFKDSVNCEILMADSVSRKMCEDIIHYTVERSCNTLIVNYSLDSEATINSLVCNSRGILYARKNVKKTQGNDYQMVFDITSLPAGEYVLYINVNGKAYNEKFKK